MGRYAFFSTGYEYKFAFGIQSSQDILAFGGWLRMKHGLGSDSDSDSADYEEHVRWDQEDLELIHKKLTSYSGQTLPDIATYEKTLEGLERFRRTIQASQENKPDAEENTQFLLGALIYFQLHMAPTLNATFEP